MGYRHYMYKIPKKTVKEIENLTIDELKKKYGDPTDDYYISLLSDGKLGESFTHIYGFGKLYWDDTAERIYSKGKPLFNNEDTQDYFEDYQPYVVGKKGLLEAINIYTERIRKNYNDLLEDGKEIQMIFGITEHQEIPKETKWEEHIQDMCREWNNNYMLPYNLDEDTDMIINSWKYEYGVFELVRLYKSINFNEYDIVFLGY